MMCSGSMVATQLWHHLYLGGGLCELPGLDYAAGTGANQKRAVA